MEASTRNWGALENHADKLSRIVVNAPMASRIALGCAIEMRSYRVVWLHSGMPPAPTICSLSYFSKGGGRLGLFFWGLLNG